jgi:hypothetical protein
MEALRIHAGLGRLYAHLWMVTRSIERDPRAATYLDRALMPVEDDEDETLDLMTQTTGAKSAVAHIKKIAELTGAH